MTSEYAISVRGRVEGQVKSALSKQCLTNEMRDARCVGARCETWDMDLHKAFE